MPKTEFVPVVEVPLIAVTEEVFGGKGGQPDTTMYRLYMADAQGPYRLYLQQQAPRGGRGRAARPCGA